MGAGPNAMRDGIDITNQAGYGHGSSGSLLSSGASVQLESADLGDYHATEGQMESQEALDDSQDDETELLQKDKALQEAEQQWFSERSPEAIKKKHVLIRIWRSLDRYMTT